MTGSAQVLVVDMHACTRTEGHVLSSQMKTRKTKWVQTTFITFLPIASSFLGMGALVQPSSPIVPVLASSVTEAKSNEKTFSRLLDPADNSTVQEDNHIFVAGEILVKFERRLLMSLGLLQLVQVPGVSS